MILASLPQAKKIADDWLRSWKPVNLDRLVHNLIVVLSVNCRPIATIG
jgi:hypothetical protein